MTSYTTATVFLLLESEAYWCHHCKRELKEHAENKQCLFDITFFEAMTWEEYQVHRGWTVKMYEPTPGTATTSHSWLILNTVT